LLGLPGTASADVIGVLAGNGNTQGVVSINTFSESPITQLRAHLISPETQQEVAVIDDFTRTYGDERSGYWESNQPVHLPIASYRVDVDATDAAGTQIVGVHAGYFASDVRTQFDQVKLSRTTVDYYHRTVMMRGRLTGQFNDTTEVRPLAGFTVTVMVDYADTVDAVTAADGSFAATVTLAGAQTVQAVYRYSNDHLLFGYSETDPTLIPVVRSATRLTAQLSRTAINIGDPLTLSGRLTWRSRDGWRPLAGVVVGIIDGYQVIGPVVTNAHGAYSVALQPYSSSTVEVSHHSPDPYLADAQTSASYTVAQLSEFTDFSAARDETGAVAVLGHLDFPGSFTPAPIPVDIEFSTDGARWRRAAAIPDAFWDGMGYDISATVDQKRAGYWRAHYRGTPDFQPAVTDPVHVGRA
jgi:hypothetical protein